MRALDKHSSLLRALVNYSLKKFYNTGPRCGASASLNVFITDAAAKKATLFVLANFFKLVV